MPGVWLIDRPFSSEARAAVLAALRKRASGGGHRSCTLRKSERRSNALPKWSSSHASPDRDGPHGRHPAHIRRR
jgi:hypothetical protein